MVKEVNSNEVRIHKAEEPGYKVTVKEHYEFAMALPCGSQSLKKGYEMIDRFKNEYEWLSNMYPCTVIINMNEVYKSAESAYQASKCAVADDRQLFFDLNGYQAKRLGKMVKIRNNWNEIRVEEMRTIVTHKFLDRELMEKLIDTYPMELVEGNDWGDTFWGVCRGEGENNLGKILMELREKSIPLPKKMVR